MKGFVILVIVLIIGFIIYAAGRKQEIEKQRIRMNASKNGFVRTCCQQEIDQLRDEMEAIEMEVVG